MKKQIIYYRILFIFVIIVLLATNIYYLEIKKKYINKQEDLKSQKNELKEELSFYKNNYNEYLFLGDSITDFYKIQKYFPDYPVINSGISGNTTKDILENLETRVYKYNPSKLILLIGINDITHYKDIDYIENNIKKIVKKIKTKFPNCEIYIESVYPINEEWKKRYSGPDLDIVVKSIVKLNQKIKSYCESNDYKYIDVYSSLVDNNSLLKSKFSDDGLHLNDVGYKVVTEILINNIS